MKKVLFWTVAVAITVIAALYQRMTGPSYPESFIAVIDGTEYALRLKRSQTNTHPCLIKLELASDISGRVSFRRLRMNEEW